MLGVIKYDLNFVVILYFGFGDIWCVEQCEYFCVSNVKFEFGNLYFVVFFVILLVYVFWFVWIECNQQKGQYCVGCYVK